MKLYIANTTKQVQQIHYRVPEIARVIVEEIKIGEQIRAFKEDALPNEIESIVVQIERYGAVRADAVDRSKEFNGVCYSIDKPIKSDTVVRVVAHNDDVLEKRGFEQRQAAAIAVAVDAGINDRGGVSEVEIEIVEEAKPGDDGEKLNQTTRVVRDGEDTDPRPRKRK